MGPLLVGLCFGLAYVVTGRLLEDRLGGLVPLGRRFSSKPVPGLTLESLRMRYGAGAGQFARAIAAVAPRAGADGCRCASSSGVVCGT